MATRYHQPVDVFLVPKFTPPGKFWAKRFFDGRKKPSDEDGTVLSSWNDDHGCPNFGSSHLPEPSLTWTCWNSLSHIYNLGNWIAMGNPQHYNISRSQRSRMSTRQSLSASTNLTVPKQQAFQYKVPSQVYLLNMAIYIALHIFNDDFP